MRTWSLGILRQSFSLVLRALHLLTVAMATTFKSRTALQVENIALRHQLAVLRRSVKRPKLTSADRLLWAWLCEAWSDWRSSLVIVKPETVIGWHRKGFRLFWTWKVRRGQPGPPTVSKEIRQLIRRMSRDNPLGCAAHPWGIAQAGHRHRRNQRGQVPRTQAQSTLANLEDLPGESHQEHGLGRVPFFMYPGSTMSSRMTAPASPPPSSVISKARKVCRASDC